VKYNSSGEKIAESTEISTEDIAFDSDGFIVALKRISSPGFSVFDQELNQISTNLPAEYDIGSTKLNIDSEGNILLVSFTDSLIRKYSLDGSITDLDFPSGQGTGAGQVSLGTVDANILTTLDSADNLYVVDDGNLRLQKFRKVDLDDQSKAIVVAAGGPFAGNNLWDATRLSANFAYRTLTYQGFSKDSIYYLSSDTALDLDQNGLADDVDADANNANLEYAITEWASDADNLLIYLVNHGGVNTFRMTGAELLLASELADWVDQLQSSLPGRVTVIYDACESGTFLSALMPEAGVDRTVITSTSPGENAAFVSQGSISFSNYFWTHIFNGLSLENSFSFASEALLNTTDHQHPMLDFDGDGLSDSSDLNAVSQVYIGNGTDLQSSAP